MRQSDKKEHKLASLGYLVIGLLASFVLVNLLISTFTEGLVLPGVKIAGEDVSFKTKSELRRELDRTLSENKITIRDGKNELVTTPTEMGLSYDLDSTVESAYREGRYYPIPLLGLISVFKSGDIGYSYSVNKELQESFYKNKINGLNQAPKNAEIKISEGNIEIVPDKEGYSIDKSKLLSKAIELASQGKGGELRLDSVLDKADFTKSDALNLKPEIESLLDRRVVLNYDGRAFEPTRKDKGFWLSFNYDSTSNGGGVKIDISKEQIQGYLQSVANQVDVAPKNKKVSVRNGTSTVIQEGQDGKTIDQSLAVEEIYKNFKNNEVNVKLVSTNIPFKTETNNSVGPEYAKYIEVNLSSQTLWAYENDVPVFSTPITSGATGKGLGTITGLFSIYSKQNSRYLNGQQYGYNYNVYVDYWMPFYSGYGFHDADWRSSFGGADYYYNGSHGCVNMPKSAAAFLYGWASVGTPVWVHN